MGEKTGIAWTDHTFNPWQGCDEVSPACDNCYAREFSKWTGFKIWGKDEPRRFFEDKHWSLPYKWDRKAAEAGVVRFVFCASFADVLEARNDLVPHRQRLFEMIRSTRHLCWLLLTKRPENGPRMLPWMLDGSDPWPNVWIGVTGENDKFAQLRARRLREIRAVRRFISYEPALEAVDWDEVLGPGGIQWVIGGGESGGHARETELSYLRNMVVGCRKYGVLPFVKQLGRFPRSGGELVQLRDRKHGGDIEEFPVDLQIRERPSAVR
jgi:protein gp37